MNEKYFMAIIFGPEATIDFQTATYTKNAIGRWNYILNQLSSVNPVLGSFIFKFRQGEDN